METTFAQVERAATLAMDAPATFVPASHRKELADYINTGRHVGPFIMCILENNLQGAITAATTASSLHIVSIVRWLWKYAPAACFGSPTARKAWINARARDARLMTA